MQQQKTNSIKKNFLLSVVYQALNTVTPLLTVPYISRILGPENIGEYSYTFAIANYFCMFGLLGSSVYGQLEVSKSRDDRKKTSMVFSTIIYSRIITMSIALIFYWIFIFFQIDNNKLYIVLIVFLASQIIDIAWFFQGMEKFDITVSCNVFAKLVSIICIFWFVKEQDDLILYAGLINGASLFGNILMWINVKKYVSFYKIPFKSILTNVKYNLTFFIPTIATMIFGSLDKCMIAWITKSNFENGYYEQANKIYNMMVALITSLTTVMLPRVAYLWQKNYFDAKLQSYLVKVVRCVSMITFPIAIGMLIVAGDFVPIFFGIGYEKCIILIRIFAFILIFTCHNSIISNMCMVANNNQSKLNKLIVVSSSINTVLNSIFICFWQSVGAALSSFVSEGVLLIMIVFSNRKILPYKDSLRLAMRYFLCSLVMILFIWPLKLLDLGSLSVLLLEIIVGAIFYVVLLLTLKDELVLNTIDLFKNYAKKLIDR